MQNQQLFGTRLQACPAGRRRKGMAETLCRRNEVPEELTWDLSLIYETEEEMNSDLRQMQDLAGQIKETWPGKLNTPEAIRDCLDAFRRVFEWMTLVRNYTGLAVEVDYYDSANQDRSSRIDRICSRIDSGLSFIDSELAQQSEDVLKAAMELAPEFRGYLERVLREKPHRLHPEAERVLAAISHTVNAPYEIYSTLKLADMQFPSFTAGGKEYPLGYSLFEDNYEYEPETAVRRGAFDAFSAKIREYENGTAAAYNAYVQHVKSMADLRGYKDMWAPDLLTDQVTREMYDRQIDRIMEDLAPHMRKFAKLLQKVHHLDRMTYADLKLPVDPGYSPAVTIDAAWDMIEKGLSLMGDDYTEMIRTARRECWVDFARNQGKSTGGFCASPYGRPSFILLSWNDKMSDMFTLAHELGHAGHFKLCNEAQCIFDTEVSGYFVEAPSTMNELFMAHYLLKTENDPRFRRWVLANMVSNTYYHNFVTHLLEAAYQREVYQIVDGGGSVQAETLGGIFKNVLEKFWGDAVELTPGADLTWMRQPHYYMGLYSYSYSAGLTVATQMCKRIEAEGAPAVEDWKKVLTAGSTLPPMGLAALGGVDISTDAALKDTIATIGSYIDEICRLTEELS